MTLEELIQTLRMAAVNENTITAMTNAYNLGFEAAQEDRHALQKEGKHPAPCARFCEANAFNIEIGRLKAQRKPLTHDQRVAVAAAWRDGNGTASEIIDMVEAAHGIKE